MSGGQQIVTDLIGWSCEPIGGKGDFEWRLSALWLDTRLSGLHHLRCAIVSQFGHVKEMWLDEVQLMSDELPGRKP